MPEAVSNSRPAVQGTIQSAIRWLQTVANVTDSLDSEAAKVAKLRALHIFRNVPGVLESEVFKAMRDHWSPRCDAPWPDKSLRDQVSAARWTYESEKNNPARVARVATPDTLTDMDKRIAERLGCAVQHAGLLRRGKTTNLGHAKVLADVLGGTPEEYMRRKNRTGPKVDVAKILMSLRIPGGGFRDFVMAAELGDDFDPYDVALEELKAQTGNAMFEQCNIETMEALGEHIARTMPDSEPALRALWKAFQDWHIDRVAAFAKRRKRNA